jgi:uncharacterized protein YbjT (DUF2867 family)
MYVVTGATGKVGGGPLARFLNKGCPCASSCGTRTRAHIGNLAPD